MKFFFACLAHETNNRSPLPTTLQNFAEMFLYRPSQNHDVRHRDAFYRMVDMPRIARERGHCLADSVIAFAMPSLPLRWADYDTLRSEILDDLKQAMPVDFVVLFMHGAQMAQGCDDVEGDLIAAVRDLVGPDIPVGVELDLHANVTPAMVARADILLACKEYPHTDWHKMAVHLVKLLEDRVRGDIAPAMGFARVPMLDLFPTTTDPMKSFVERVRELERQPGILAITLAHGFPITDYEYTGASVIVVSDGDQGKADTLAQQLAQEFFALRGAASDATLSMDDAIDRALAVRGGPVVISDNSDNEGGAAPGDSTFFLQRLLARNVKNAAVAMIWDPQAVRFALDAGVGAVLPLRVGGKVGAMSGPPLDVMATVTAINPDARQRGIGTTHYFGPAAAIKVDDIHVVLSSVRQQTFSPDCLMELGIQAADKKIIIVKSRQHFYDLFQPIAADILYSGRFPDTRARLRATPFERLSRPVWPLDDPPFTAFGRTWA